MDKFWKGHSTNKAWALARLEDQYDVWTKLDLFNAMIYFAGRCTVKEIAGGIAFVSQQQGERGGT